MYTNPYSSSGVSAQGADLSGWGKLLLSYMSASNGTTPLSGNQAAAFKAGAGPVNADYATQLRAGQGNLSGADPFYVGENRPFNWQEALSQYNSGAAGRDELAKYASVPVSDGSKSSSY
jgi:hypothetical protein